MAVDPVLLKSRLQIIKMSADLEVQLTMIKGSAPALVIIAGMKEDAAVALSAMALSNDSKEIADCQMRVRAFDYFVQKAKELIVEGKQYDQEITISEREEILDMLSQSPEGQREAIDLGLVDEIPRGGD